MLHLHHFLFVLSIRTPLTPNPQDSKKIPAAVYKNHLCSIAFISGNTLIIISYFCKHCKLFFKIICVFPFPTIFPAQTTSIFIVLYSFTPESLSFSIYRLFSFYCVTAIVCVSVVIKLPFSSVCVITIPFSSVAVVTNGAVV